MLEKISRNELPGGRQKAPNSIFAEKCVDDFIALNCDAVRVSEWPVRRETKSLVSAMRKAVKDKNMVHKVKVQSDKDFVYLSLKR